MRERDGRHCDRCGALLTRKNNRCGFELCDTCNDELEEAYEKIKNKMAAGGRLDAKTEVNHIMAAGRTHIVYMNGNKICPVCAGSMVTIPGMDLAYRCIDCRTRFEIVDLASEKEMIIQEVS